MKEANSTTESASLSRSEDSYNINDSRDFIKKDLPFICYEQDCSNYFVETSPAKCEVIDKMIQSENTEIRNWIDDLVALKLYYKSINSYARLD